VNEIAILSLVVVTVMESGWHTGNGGKGLTGVVSGSCSDGAGCELWLLLAGGPFIQVGKAKYVCVWGGGGGGKILKEQGRDTGWWGCRSEN
jgi:hypothetical protein